MKKEEGKDSAVEAKAPIFTKAQHQEQMRKQAAQRKQMETELADYKKRLMKGNEMKRMQVEEIRLNIDYFKAKREYMELGPEIEKLEAKEQAQIAEDQAKHKKLMEEQEKKMKKEKEKQEKEKKKSDIVIATVGVARDK
jgi:hypothetical protein